MNISNDNNNTFKVLLIPFNSKELGKDKKIKYKKLIIFF